MEEESKVYALYKKLLNKYGPQGWWPAETPYEVLVGAILTQNTNWNNVEKALRNLRPYLEPEKILALDNETLMELIRPSGYFTRKALTLKEATKWFLEADKSKDTMELRKELLSIKGIGRETADSILLYAFDKLIFVIDAYTKRFCDYYKLFKAKDYDEYRLFFESNLPRDLELYKEYHALIVRWGKDFRRKIAEVPK